MLIPFCNYRGFLLFILFICLGVCCFVAKLQSFCYSVTSMKLYSLLILLVNWTGIGSEYLMVQFWTNSSLVGFNSC